MLTAGKYRNLILAVCILRIVSMVFVSHVVISSLSRLDTGEVKNSFACVDHVNHYHKITLSSREPFTGLVLLPVYFLPVAFARFCIVGP